MVLTWACVSYALLTSLNYNLISVAHVNMVCMSDAKDEGGQNSCNTVRPTQSASGFNQGHHQAHHIEHLKRCVGRAEV